jgi:membrane protein
VFVERLRSLLATSFEVIAETYGQWRRHRTIRLGAGIAYYGLFALVPMLAVALALAGLVLSTADIQSYLSEQMSKLLGTDADTVASALAEVLDSTGRLTGLGVVGAASLVLTASVLVVALQDSFNTIWERPVRSGLRQTIVRRLVAFAVVAGAGAVIIVSFAINAVTGILTTLVPDVAVLESLQELIGLLASWALGIGVIVLLFRFLTDVRVPWREAIIGGAVTAVMVAVGAVLVGAYLRRYAASSLVGVTGSVFLALLWIYYEAQIVLAGAEFTRVLTLRRAVRAGSAGGDREAGAGPGEDAAVDVDR